jgi:hypothetical protein
MVPLLEHHLARAPGRAEISSNQVIPKPMTWKPQQEHVQSIVLYLEKKSRNQAARNQAACLSAYACLRVIILQRAAKTKCSQIRRFAAPFARAFRGRRTSGSPWNDRTAAAACKASSGPNASSTSAFHAPSSLAATKACGTPWSTRRYSTKEIPALHETELAQVGEKEWVGGKRAPIPLAAEGVLGVSQKNWSSW